MRLTPRHRLAAAFAPAMMAVGCEGESTSDVPADGDIDTDADSDTGSGSDSDTVTCIGLACGMAGGTCMEEVDCGTGCPVGDDIGPEPPCSYCSEGFKCCGVPPDTDCAFVGGVCAVGGCAVGTAEALGMCETPEETCCVPSCE
jgi:hypothetical protein